MGSPLGPVLANIFKCDFEKKWVMKNINRPTIWFRYVDDASTLFKNKNDALSFLHYLNGRHKYMKFTTEFEQNDEILFLDILLKRNLDNSFSTSIYRKKTFTDLYTKWDSFTTRKYKIIAPVSVADLGARPPPLILGKKRRNDWREKDQQGKKIKTPPPPPPLSSRSGSATGYSRRSRVRIPLKPWFFQASSFQLLKLEN